MSLQEEIIEDLTIELSNDVDFNPQVLAVKVKNAYREVKALRNYKASRYTEEQIESDMQQFYSNILGLARYDYNQIGAEGQSQHTESDITRTWINRSTYFSDVYPFVDIIV